MPSFSHPWLLLGLLILPALFWRRAGGQRLALPLPTMTWATPLASARAKRSERWGRWLPPIALALLLVAAAGPRLPDPHQTVQTEGISIALVLDVSASMGNLDFAIGNQLQRRLDGARYIVRLLIAGGEGPGGLKFAGRGQDSLALIAFATRPDTVCPLTLDHPALLKMMDDQDTRSGAAEATTNPGDAIAWAASTLRSAPTRQKAILLVTDGEANVVPPALSPRQAAQIAGNLGIPVYPLDVSGEADEGDAAKARKILEDVAAITKGGYFRANDGTALSQAMQTIDRLQRDRVAGLERRPYHDLAPWFAIAGLIGLIGLLGTEATVWRKLP